MDFEKQICTRVCAPVRLCGRRGPADFAGSDLPCAGQVASASRWGEVSVYREYRDANLLQVQVFLKTKAVPWAAQHLSRGCVGSHSLSPSASELHAGCTCLGLHPECPTATCSVLFPLRAPALNCRIDKAGLTGMAGARAQSSERGLFPGAQHL